MEKTYFIENKKDFILQSKKEKKKNVKICFDSWSIFVIRKKIDVKIAYLMDSVDKIIKK